MCCTRLGALPHVACPPGHRPESFTIKTHFLHVGKYLISPLVKSLATGRLAASVSIRSGSGSATHDRVLRLLPTFNTESAAVAFALREGLAWVQRYGVAGPVPAELPVSALVPRSFRALSGRRHDVARELLHAA